VNSGYALAVFVFSLMAIVLGQKEENEISERNQAARFFYSFSRPSPFSILSKKIPLL